MINGKKIIAIIPARGGSKRLPRKNILPLKGKPLIAWTIEAAQKSQYVDNIFVSTDDSEIAYITKMAGLDIPELRPEYLATDSATSLDVIQYTLNKFGQGYDIVILLQPTSPLRTFKHIDEAIELYLQKSAKSVVSITPCEHSPLWANVLKEDGSMEDFIKLDTLKFSKSPQYYRLNGAIYIFDAEEIKKAKEISYDCDSYAYIMSNYDSIDIDVMFDFKFAEFILYEKE